MTVTLTRFCIRLVPPKLVVPILHETLLDSGLPQRLSSLLAGTSNQFANSAIREKL